MNPIFIQKPAKLLLPFLICILSASPPVLDAKPAIRLGVDYLEDTGFGILKGKRVGLLTHPAGKNGSGRSTVDVLFGAGQVKLVSLFGPEHGIYGDEKAANAR